MGLTGAAGGITEYWFPAIGDVTSGFVLAVVDGELVWINPGSPGLGYIPYTGATSNVNLGTFDLSADLLTSTALTSGSIIFAGTGGLLSQDNSKWFYNTTLDRVGLGLNSSIRGGLHVLPTLESIAQPASISGVLTLESLISAPTNTAQVILTPGAEDVTGLVLTPIDIGSGGFTDNAQTIEVTVWAIDDTTVGFGTTEIASITGAFNTYTGSGSTDTFNLQIDWDSIADAERYIVKVYDPNSNTTTNYSVGNQYISVNTSSSDASEPSNFPIVSAGGSRNYKVSALGTSPSGITYYSAQTSYSVTEPTVGARYVIGHSVNTVTGAFDYKWLGSDSGTTFGNSVMVGLTAFIEYRFVGDAFWSFQSSDVTVTPTTYGITSSGQSYQYRVWSTRVAIPAYTFYSSSFASTGNITFPNDGLRRYISVSYPASTSEGVTYKVLRSTNGGSTFPSSVSLSGLSLIDDALKTWAGDAVTTPANAQTPAHVIQSPLTALDITNGNSDAMWLGTTGSGVITGLSFGSGLTNRLGRFFFNTSTSVFQWETNSTMRITNSGGTSIYASWDSTNGTRFNPGNLTTSFAKFTLNGGTNVTLLTSIPSSNSLVFGGTDVFDLAQHSFISTSISKPTMILRAFAGASADYWRLQSDLGTDITRFDINGRLGLGTAAVSPTAWLTIGAGTTTVPAIRLIDGVYVTTPLSGSIEWDVGTAENPTFTPVSTRYRIPLIDSGVGGLTSTRVPFATTNGRLTDDADFTFATDTLTVTKAVVKRGGAATFANVGGTIFDYFTDSTVGGAETDIYSSTLDASLFATNGDKVTATYNGNFVTVGTEIVQLQIKLAGTTIWDSTGIAVTTGTSSWNVDVKLIRVSSTVIRYVVTLNTTGASGFVYCTSGELTGLTLTNTNILKLTGTSSGVGSGSGDIVGKSAFVEFKPTA